MVVDRYPTEDTKLEDLETKVQGGGPCATALVAARSWRSAAYMATSRRRLLRSAVYCVGRSTSGGGGRVGYRYDDPNRNVTVRPGVPGPGPYRSSDVPYVRFGSVGRSYVRTTTTDRPTDRPSASSVRTDAGPARPTDVSERVRGRSTETSNRRTGRPANLRPTRPSAVGRDRVRYRRTSPRRRSDGR